MAAGREGINLRINFSDNRAKPLVEKARALGMDVYWHTQPTNVP